MENEINPQAKALPPGKRIGVYKNGTKVGYLGLWEQNTKYGTEWICLVISLDNKSVPIWYIEPENDDWNYLIISPEGYPGKLGWYDTFLLTVGLREAASWGYWRFHPDDDSTHKPARLVYNTHDGAYGYMIYVPSDEGYWCYLEDGAVAKGEVLYFGIEDP